MAARYKAFVCWNVGDVGYPNMVGSIRSKVLFQQVISNWKVVLGISGSLVLSLRLGSNAIFSHQSGYSVFATFNTLLIECLGDPGTTVGFSGSLIDFTDLFQQLYVLLLAATGKPATPGIISASGYS